MLMLGTLRAWKHKVLDGVASAPRAAVVTDGRRESLKDRCEPGGAEGPRIAEASVVSFGSAGVAGVERSRLRAARLDRDDSSLPPSG